MGEIVAAVGTCHTPYMFTRPPDEDPNQLAQAGAAMQELGKVLDETKPDAILFFGADHVETFSVSCVPSFAIVAGDRAIARFAGREHNLPIHREMAEDILNKLVTDHNFDMAYSEDAELGHAFSIPFEYVIGKRPIPVIPFFTNVYVPPLPTPRRCEALGKALRKIIEGRGRGFGRGSGLSGVACLSRCVACGVVSQAPIRRRASVRAAAMTMCPGPGCSVRRSSAALAPAHAEGRACPGLGDPPVFTAAAAARPRWRPAGRPAGARRGSAACGRSRWWRSSSRGVC